VASGNFLVSAKKISPINHESYSEIQLENPVVILFNIDNDRFARLKKKVVEKSAKNSKNRYLSVRAEERRAKTTKKTKTKFLEGILEKILKKKVFKKFGRSFIDRIGLTSLFSSL